MTYSEAHAEWNRLRGIAAQGGGLATVKKDIAKLYAVVCRKQLRQCGCKNILDDAMFEIYAKLKKYENDMDTINTHARLVNGVVLPWKGNHYTNSNLTDKVAREFLAAFPQRRDWFAELPEEEQKAEAPENSAQVAPKAIKKAQQATTPKKGKAPKKGK